MAEKTGKRYGVWIIVVLLFIALLGFGTGGFGGRLQSLGYVGEQTIRVNDYQQALNQQLRAFEQQTNSRLTFAQAQAIGIDRNVLSQLIQTNALENEAAMLGLSVGDERVRDEVLRIPSFQGLNGSFDREGYESALRYSGQSVASFEDGIRDDMARSLLQAALASGISAPDVFADTVTAYMTERRNITWAHVDETHLAEDPAAPTDAELTTFYEGNPDLFTQPEIRNISYAWLTPEMIQDQMEIDETALHELYDERIDEFVQAERRLVERLVYSDEAAAEAAIAEINAGTSDFETQVSNRGLDLADVDLGDVDQASLGAAGDAAFAAAPGDIVGPFETNLGPALFRINAVLSAEEITFEEAQPDLRAELATARARRVIDDAREAVNDLLAGGAALSDLAARTDMQLGTIAWSADVRDDIAAYDEFRSIAAQASEGAFPELYDTEDGGIFTLVLDGITPPSVRPQFEVEADLRAAWAAASKKSAIMAHANALKDQILPVTSFDSLGLTANEEPEIARQSFIEGTPPEFTQAVYDMDPGEIHVVENEDTAVIIRLNDVYAPADAEAEIAANREMMVEAISAGIAQDLFDAYSDQVLLRTDVAIDQPALNAIHVNMQ
jgi:peptidyl-prolyl cis-trans isomerase D